MSVWIMSVVGVVCLGVLLDIIVPDGEINKYIKSVFSIVTVLVIVAPLPLLINSDFDIGHFFTERAEFATDETFLTQVDWQLQAENTARLARAMEDAGVSGALSTVTYGVRGARDIEAVHINLTLATYEGTRAEVTERLRVAVAGRLRIARSRVYVT